MVKALFHLKTAIFDVFRLKDVGTACSLERQIVFDSNTFPTFNTELKWRVYIDYKEKSKLCVQVNPVYNTGIVIVR